MNPAFYQDHNNMSEGEILDKIDEWHDGDHDCNLYEFLGWSWAEYCDYIDNGKIPNNKQNN